ncbi:MAG: valine--tRNA ligase [Candidatus Hodarchaeales archaeon]|jgi:valyl-tRNA synthetase
MQNKRFDFLSYEPRILRFWKEEKIYSFTTESNDGEKPLFLIDTPPPYANGALHHGHGMSYTHIDFIARYRRLKGYNTLFPLCYDDNGLPTEKYTEKKYGIKPGQHPENFKELCKKEAELSIDIQTRQLEALGFSYNHEISYRTIDDTSSKITQENFLDFYAKDLIRRTYEPQMYCTSCRTALSQADIITKGETSSLHFIEFPAILKDNQEKSLIIATTRPEFLPACSAVFYNPKDSRYNDLQPLRIFNPWNGDPLLFLPDPRIEITFGSGLMMCCTFGSQEDIMYYREHGLPLIEILGQDGKLNDRTAFLEGKTILEARRAILEYLCEESLVLKSESINHAISTCERCGTPMEITMSWQWSLDIISFKETLLKAGKQINWYPKHMRKRFESWTSGLKWNWIISRQRHYGIPIPTWYCRDCKDIILPSPHELPIDPKASEKTCPRCGSKNTTPEKSVFDTWMTSSLSPRILNGIYFRNKNDNFYPFNLRPQAHEIIRTWAFYTIYKEIASGSGKLPWKEILISGWGLGFQKKGKRNIKASKSSGGGIDPLELCRDFGADGFRYWAAQARPGKDQHLNEKALIRGKKLTTKIYNATKIIIQLIETSNKKIKSINDLEATLLSMTDHLESTIKDYETCMDSYDYTDALKKLENSFWNHFCSGFIEKLKEARNDGFSEKTAFAALKYHETYLLLFAPFLPFITEYCWATIWKKTRSTTLYQSIHELQLQKTL